MVELGLAHQEPILGGHLHGVAQRGDAAGNDRYLLYRVSARQGHGHDGVAQLVVSHDFLLGGIDQAILFFQTRHQTLDRLLDLGHADFGLVAPNGEQGRFVDEIGQVGTHHTGRHTGNLFRVDRPIRFHLVEIDLENVRPTDFIRPVDQDLAIETAGSQQGRIQDLGPVGGRHQNDAHVGIETVELHQQLVECLLPFVMASGGGHAAGFAQGIELVDKNDARRLFLGLLEQVPHPGRTQPHEHFHELGAAEAEKRYAALTGYGLGQQRFARAGWAHEQNAAWNLTTNLGVALGLF